MTENIKLIEKKVKSQIKLRKEFQRLLTVPGIGDIPAFTIMLEVGDINRFPKAGNYSFCRCVKSERLSDGKGNKNNGNKYLAWAYVEAANFAIRFVNVQGDGLLPGYPSALSSYLSEILWLAQGVLKTRRRLKQFKPLILRFAKNLSKAAAIRFQGIQAIDYPP